MAKKIFCTDTEINQFLDSANKSIIETAGVLKNKKFKEEKDWKIDVGINLLDFIRDERKATLYFTKSAWIKMYALINHFSTEVQWHGTVKRHNESTFIIEDILTFPHKVTGTTVTSDEEEYTRWRDNLDDDTFNALRFHGHSHVNMGVTPSSVDTTYRRSILDNFSTPTPESDLFYIFLIANKSMDISVEIYDLQNNALYSTNEVSIKIPLNNQEYLSEFLKNAKDMVKKETYNWANPSKPATQPSFFGTSAATTNEKKNNASEESVAALKSYGSSTSLNKKKDEEKERKSDLDISDEWWKNRFGHFCE